MTDEGGADDARRMREGIRARVVEVAGRAGGQLRKLTPTGVVALLCASAFGPVLGVSLIGASALTAVAAIGVLGSVGANVLTDVLLRAVRKPGDQAALEERVNAEVAEVLLGGGALAGELRVEIAAVLKQVGGVDAAVRAAVESGDRDIQDQLTEAFGHLAGEFGEFGFVVAELRSAAADIQETLRAQGAEHRADRERSRDQSTLLNLMRNQLSHIERQTRGAADGTSTASRRWVGGSPYRGLSPYEQDHSTVYYGRDVITAELITYLGARLTGLGLAVVTGASGAGKSSLLRAGVVPAIADGLLAHGSATWPRVVMTPTGTPLEELATRLAAIGGPDAATTHRSLAADPSSAHLLAAEVVLRHTEGSPSSPVQPRLVLVVDQFEQVFGVDGGATAFLDALRAMAGKPVGSAAVPAALVVLCVRGDYWDRCAALPQLVDVLRDGQFVVGPMTESELRLSIDGPAAEAGVELESRLTDTILGDVRSLSGSFDVASLPLLSQAMLVTWENREGDLLTHRGYARSGGVGHAVESSAEEVFEGLAAAHQELAGALFRGLAAWSGDGPPTRRRRGRQDLASTVPDAAPADVDTVLEAFAAKRLVVFGDGGVEVSHDALFHAWPRLRDWLDLGHTDRELRRRLAEVAQRWHAEHREPSVLYRGGQILALREAASRWERQGTALRSEERDFVDASVRADRRTRLLRRAAIVLLVVLLVGVSITAVAAVRSAAEADRQHALALSRQLAAQSDALLRTDPGTAQRLAVAAWRISPTSQAEYSLRNSLTARQRKVLAAPGKGVTDAVYTPKGDVLITAGGDGAVWLWDPVTGGRTGEIPTGHEGWINSIAVSPRGEYLATAGADKTVRLWDLRTRTQVGRTMVGHEGDVTHVAFSPDGDVLASASDDYQVRLWNVRTQEQLGDPLKHLGSVSGAAFSPKGSLLAVAGGNGSVRLWNPTTRHQVGADLAVGEDNVYAVAFSPDGTLLATGGADHQVRLWDTATWNQVGPPLQGHTGGVFGVTFSPDGSTLASTGSDQSTILWDVATHDVLTAPLTGHTDLVHTAAFSPDGTVLATASSDGTARLWEVKAGLRIGKPFTGHTFWVHGVAIDRDGRTIASAGGDGTVRLWDVKNHDALGAPVTGEFKEAAAVAFAPGGRRFAASTHEGLVLEWDLDTRQQTGPPMKAAYFAGNPEWVDSLAYRPDGKVIVSAGHDTKVHFWDASTHVEDGAPMEGHKDWIDTVVYSPDGTLLATGSADDTVLLWDATTRKPIGDPLTGHGSTVTGVAFSPDGTTLASGSADGTARLWDVRTHRQLGDPLAHGSTGVAGVAFSPDGRTLATAGGEGLIRLWDVATHWRLGSALSGSRAGVTEVAFSPDGTMLVGSGNDETVRLWDTGHVDDPAGAVCAFAGELSTTEWDRYASGEPYRHTCG